MKIAVANALLPSDEQSGVPYQVHRLANAFASLGHDVTVFSFSPKPIDATYAVRTLPRRSRFRKLDPFFFAYELARVEFSAFDILHVHGDSFLLWNSHPHVRTFHGSAADEAKAATTVRRRLFFHVVNVLEQLSSRFSDHNTGNSEATLRRFATNASVVDCGVDVTLFSPGLKTRHPTILFVGTTEGRKRGAWLAELFTRNVLPQVPDAELLMVSDKAVHLRGVRDIGRVSDERLAELFRSSWIFCLPSTYEGFGVPYIEAMASGTAVVASPNPGSCEILCANAYGILATDDVLGRALVDLLEDDDRREALQRAGLARSKIYAWETIAAQYVEIFRRVIDGR
ncbi:MAG: glycosyltransferase family 4 protein [Candidatus Eremiobacteraeota bacterium]|nr:glycosyltransferase family 4 protein [Candidatus Eremiobacteraeota bacterium]